MTKQIEVRAALNFDKFRQGQVYAISSEDDRLMSLLGVGYLEPTSNREADYVGWDRSPELGVGSDHGGVVVHSDGVAGSPEASEELTHVTDSSESDGGKKLSSRKRPGSRTGVVDEGVDRGEDSGEAGLA